MNTTLAVGLSLSLLLSVTFAETAHSEPFEWPDTPAARVFQSFLIAYNTGSVAQMRSFVEDNYSTDDESRLAEKTGYWMDIFHRYGRIQPHSISISKPGDIEIWVQGEITRTWFAPEFVLEKDSEKIRATGMLLGMQPPGTASPSANDTEFVSRVREYLRANEEAGLFQGVVSIQKGETVVLEEAYGLKDIVTQEENRTDTRMRVISVGKVLTAVASLQLIQAGELKLHEPISSYLPDLPSHIADKITIANILTHTSGYELDGIEGFRADLEKTHSMAEVLQLQLLYLPQWEHYENFETSPRFDYSNDSYDLLAILIEKVTGVRFEAYLKTRIFDVVQMPHTSFGRENLAVPYRYDMLTDDLIGMESQYPASLGGISGAGSLKSSVGDLRNFANAVFHGDVLLDLPHRSLLLGPQVGRGGSDFQSYGMNISYDPVLSLGHAGTNFGTTAELRYYPDSDYLLVVLCNNRSGAPNLERFFKNNIPEAAGH